METHNTTNYIELCKRVNQFTLHSSFFVCSALFSRLQPLFGFGGGHTLDSLLGIYRLGAAVGVEEQLAVLGAVQGLLIAGRIAKIAKSFFANNGGFFGIVFYLADGSFHFFKLLFSGFIFPDLKISYFFLFCKRFELFCQNIILYYKKTKIFLFALDYCSEYMNNCIVIFIFFGRMPLMEKFFEEVKKNFGFGCMRLPMKDGDVDAPLFCRMVDAFLEAGFNYFDTAHGYLGGKSETAICKCLTSRYPRESYVLANKLSNPHFSTEEEILPLFMSQLEACGVDYFDFYLMHAQNKKSFEKFTQCRAYETAFQLKKQGLVRHVGLSFHDKPEVLDNILTTYPEIEMVQIQFNYADYDDPMVESRGVYEICRKHNKPIIIMEPVKGGNLANLIPEAQEVFDRLDQKKSNASYAIRYAAGFEGVFMVLSGMGDMEMMEDNLSFMTDFCPLDKKEQDAVAEVCRILRSRDLISCTNCKYCTEVCPQSISIPGIFSCLNDKKMFDNERSKMFFGMYTKTASPADCIGCRSCEDACPQHLPIVDLLAEAQKTFAD